jgi:microcin C transport system permease protein
MLWNYAHFDFGESYFRDIAVIDLIIEKMPVSISLGLWMTLISYSHLHSARHRQGGAGRVALRCLDLCGVIVGYAIPGFPVRRPADRAVCRRLFLDWFPLRG